MLFETRGYSRLPFHEAQGSSYKEKGLMVGFMGFSGIWKVTVLTVGLQRAPVPQLFIFKMEITVLNLLYC